MPTRERCEHILDLIDERLDEYDAWIDGRTRPTTLGAASTTPAFPARVVDALDAYRVAS
jgi:hypothetical protein